MSSIWFLTGWCKNILIEGEIGGKRGKFALALGEEANNCGRKLTRSTVRRAILVVVCTRFV